MNGCATPPPTSVLCVCPFFQQKHLTIFYSSIGRPRMCLVYFIFNTTHLKTCVHCSYYLVVPLDGASRLPQDSKPLVNFENASERERDSVSSINKKNLNSFVNCLCIPHFKHLVATPDSICDSAFLCVFILIVCKLYLINFFNVILSNSVSRENFLLSHLTCRVLLCAISKFRFDEIVLGKLD